MQDRRIMIKELASEASISTGSVSFHSDWGFGLQDHFSEVHASVSKDRVKQICFEIAQQHMLQTLNSNPNFLCAITGDGCCVYGYDPETKMQSSQWKHPTSPSPKKARLCQSQAGLLLWLHWRGSSRLRPHGRTITKRFCVAFVTPWDANGRTSGQWANGKFITITHLTIFHIWYKVSCALSKHNTSVFVRLSTLPTWLRVTSGFSPSWKYHWKRPDFSTENILCRMWRINWTQSKKRRSSTASNSGSNCWEKCVVAKGNHFEED